MFRGLTMSKCHCMPCLKQNYVTLAVKSQAYLGLENPWRVFHTPHPSLCSVKIFLHVIVCSNTKVCSMNSKWAAQPHYLLVNSKTTFQTKQWTLQLGTHTGHTSYPQRCNVCHYSSLQKTILPNEKCIRLNCHCGFLTIKLKIHTEHTQNWKLKWFDNLTVHQHIVKMLHINFVSNTYL